MTDQMDWIHSGPADTLTVDRMQDERLRELVWQWVGKPGAPLPAPAVLPPAPRRTMSQRVRRWWFSWRLSMRFRAMQRGGRHAR